VCPVELIPVAVQLGRRETASFLQIHFVLRTWGGLRKA
jgi:hypothetical protein